jgi:hypothetical protein
MGKLETNATELKRRKTSIQRTTEISIVDLLEWCIDNGYAIDRAGLMVGSVIDPDSIANSHIRAHALEGQLFRTMLEAALEARGVSCAIFREHDAFAKATNLFRQPLGQIKRTLVDLGRSKSGSWRADQKLAALAAWILF